MISIKIESVMVPTMQIRNKNRDSDIQLEQLDNYEIGKCYPDFNIIEPFIEEYNIDLTTLKKNDIIIRDWQFGHLTNTGYRPLKVVEPFNGMNIQVENSNGHIYNICAEPSLMKNKTFHKLDKSKLKK